MAQTTPPSPAMLENPNRVHYVLEEYEATLCGLDWSERTYTTDVSEGIIETVGTCKSCKRDLEDVRDDEPSTIADFRREVAEQLEGVSPRPDHPSMVRKEEWKAIYTAVVADEER